MKMRLPVFVLAVVVIAILAVLQNVSKVYADQLTWQTPMGTFGLPFTATESLLAYDGINKVAVAGILASCLYRS